MLTLKIVQFGQRGGVEFAFINVCDGRRRVGFSHGRSSFRKKQAQNTAGTKVGANHGILRGNRADSEGKLQISQVYLGQDCKYSWDKPQQSWRKTQQTWENRSILELSEQGNFDKFCLPGGTTREKTWEAMK
jgi:hypothetical protein